MSTSKEYLAFILDQLSDVQGITHRMMMGEYLIYHYGKIAAYLCDDRLLVKPVPSAVKMMPEAEYEAISEGGRKKLLRVDNIDDRDFLKVLFEEMYPELPETKKKKRKEN